ARKPHWRPSKRRIYSILWGSDSAHDVRQAGRGFCLNPRVKALTVLKRNRTIAAIAFWVAAALASAEFFQVETAPPPTQHRSAHTTSQRPPSVTSPVAVSPQKRLL